MDSSGHREEDVALAAAHQRRLTSAAAALMISQGVNGGWEQRLPEFSWEEHVRGMYEDEFKLRYRLSWDSFHKLLDIIRPELDVGKAQAASQLHYAGSTTAAAQAMSCDYDALIMAMG